MTTAFIRCEKKPCIRDVCANMKRFRCTLLQLIAKLLFWPVQEGATGTEIVLDGGAALTNWLNHPTEGMVGVLPDQFPTGLQESLTSHNKKRKSGA